ncbi:MAG: polyprenyl synthetase family protein, partial [Dehalococcoidia bacterium]|nr:polyprenyl synthetase family protein [Dehalococcoidia bacterium]
MPITSIYEPVHDELKLVEDSLKSLARVDSPSLINLLGHVLTPQGKRIRPALTLLAGRFHNYNLEKLIPMATAVEMLHTATLIHDDTIDNSVLRRGRPTASSLWSSGIAVLAGDYLFANSARLVSTTDNVRVMRLFAETLMTICGGELSQSFASYESSQGRQDYYRRIGQKTASLFSMATESGAVLSDASESSIRSLRDYGYDLGIAFQIIDDILDFTGEAAEMGKPVGNDLLQGTLTLPAILLMERHPDDNPVSKLFGGEDVEKNVNLTVDMIRNSDIIHESFQIANEFCTKAHHDLTSLPDC